MHHLVVKKSACCFEITGFIRRLHVRTILPRTGPFDGFGQVSRIFHYAGINHALAVSAQFEAFNEMFSGAARQSGGKVVVSATSVVPSQ